LQRINYFKQNNGKGSLLFSHIFSKENKNKDFYKSFYFLNVKICKEYVILKTNLLSSIPFPQIPGTSPRMTFGERIDLQVLSPASCLGGRG
jgi:hypothetical protein